MAYRRKMRHRRQTQRNGGRQSTQPHMNAYKHAHTHAQAHTLSFLGAVKMDTYLSSMLAQCLNCLHHCTTDTELLQNTRVLFLTVEAAAMPTSVLPAPQGNTMMPERARPDREGEKRRDGGERREGEERWKREEREEREERWMRR